MNRKERVKLIRDLQSKRKSKIISLVTSDRINLETPIHQMMNDIIYKQIRVIKSKKDDFDNIDLFLYSRGGDSDAPWSIVSTIRESFPNKNFNVLIPFRAHSAATMISLGADEIVMTEKAELGPVDITISNSLLNPTHPITKQAIDISVEDVMGYLGLLNKLNYKNANDRIKSFELLSNNIHPLGIGRVNRYLEETKLVARRMLFSRNNTLKKKENEKIVNKLSSEIYSHRHSIARTEARQIGLNFVVNAEDYGIDRLLWDLYKLYAESLELEKIFNPEEHLDKNNIDDHTWNDLKKAIIETEYECYVHTSDVKAWRLRNITKPININPQIPIPTIPLGINPQDIQNFIKDWLQKNLGTLLNDATKKAMDQFLKSQPSPVINLKTIDKLWKKYE